MQITQSQLKQVKNHNFTKELKDFEYETKFNIRGAATSLEVLRKIRACFRGNKFTLIPIKGGDKLITKVIFYTNKQAEYSLFKYRGARMLKVKKHKVVKIHPKISIFKNSEELLIDRHDFLTKLKNVRQRFRRHKYQLVNLDKVLEKLKADKQTKYGGKMTKVRVKDFVLDTNGRIYSVAITFCSSGNKVQKQLEVEYAGYIKGVGKFRMNSEKEVIQGVLGLSEYIYKCLSKMLKPSTERKFEFVKRASPEI